MLEKIMDAVINMDTIRINISANGSYIFAYVAPVECSQEGTIITMIDSDDNKFSINCENVEYDEISNFYILKSGSTEVIVEFGPIE